MQIGLELKYSSRRPQQVVLTYLTEKKNGSNKRTAKWNNKKNSKTNSDCFEDLFLKFDRKWLT